MHASSEIAKDKACGPTTVPHEPVAPALTSKLWHMMRYRVKKCSILAYGHDYISFQTVQRIFAQFDLRDL